MSIVTVSLVDSTSFKPILVQSKSLYNFSDAMISVKEAVHKIVNYKNNRKPQRQFMLESGLLLMYEPFWDQILL